MHVNLLVTRSAISLSREEIAWMLSLCGLGMLAAQIFHARLDWLVTMPRRLAGLTLGLLAAHNRENICVMRGRGHRCV
ncbi:hypothetical protein SSCI18S_04547 [Sphingobium scionense]